MRFLKLIFVAAILLVIVGGGAGWFLAGREPGPTITISAPEKFIGRATPFSITFESPTEITSGTFYFDQGGKPLSIADIKVNRDTHRWVLSGTVGKDAVNGPVRLTVEGSRKTFFGLRTVFSRDARDLTARVDPPRVAVVSLHHYVNHGGAEFVVLRATPEDVEAGILVGDARYPAYPGSAVGLSDPALRVGFFALRHDQDLNVRIAAYARDAADNEITAPLDHRPFAKRFLDSRIPIDQRFLDRVVPAIASNTPGLTVDTGSTEGLLKGFLEINGNLRRKNNDAITAMAAKTQPRMLWNGAFQPMGNAQVESRFADRRTYFFDNREIDRQVHLGFDLASVQQDRVLASHAGTVVFADYLGIYGNCVIVDHGLGVQSLYAHLSTMDVREGDTVTKGQQLGRTGATGLAGGDHLHFTMLLQGVPVNPIEWWDPKWMQDRVFRKVEAAR